MVLTACVRPPHSGTDCMCVLLFHHVFPSSCALSPSSLCPLSLLSDSRPLARQLHILRSSSGQTVKVRVGVAARWSDLAFQLELPHYEIKTIEHHARDSKKAVDDVIYHWLNGSARLPVTWRTLLEALQDAEFTTLAIDLKTVLESFAK